MLVTCAEVTAGERWLQLSQRLQASRDAGADLVGREFDGQGVDADASLATARYAGAEIDLLFAYSYHEYDIAGLSGATLDAHDVRLPVVARWALPAGTAVAHLGAGFATSSNVINRLKFESNDLVLDVAGAWMSPRTGGRAWVAGAAVDRRFGATRWYPLLGIDYRPDERWRLTLVLPEPVIVHRPAPRWWWGLRVAPSGNRWRMLDSVSGRRYRLRERSWTATGLASYAWREALQLTIGIQHSWDRALDVRDGSDVPLRARPGSTWSLNFGLAVGASPARLHGERW